MQNRSANFFALVASTSTLLCCALPALFVTVGAGASFASLVGTFPFLIGLSKYKIELSCFALMMLLIAGLMNYRAVRLPCPADPELGKACLQSRQRSQRLYYLSAVIFLFASIFTYIAPAFIW